MAVPRIKALALSAVASVTLSACVTDGGYGGLSVGYGSAGYYGNPYYGGGYGHYASGWYDDFYYPGGGYYVYDRRGARHAWNDNQRRYWEGRRYTLRDREDRQDFRAFRLKAARISAPSAPSGWRIVRRFAAEP